MIPQTDIRTFYEFQPIIPVSQGWQFLILAAFVLAVLSFVIWMYVRDSRELPRGLTVLLSGLRITAFICILIYVLNPGKRSETRIVKTSRLAVLIDTSLSMGLSDEAPVPSQQEGPRRIDEVIEWLGSSPEIETLRQRHDVSIYRFGDQSQPELVTTYAKSEAGSFPQPGGQPGGGGPDEAGNQVGVGSQLGDRQPGSAVEHSLESSRRFGWLAIALAALAISLLTGWLFASQTERSAAAKSQILCAAVFGIVLTLVGLAVCDLQTPQFDLWTSMGWKPADTDAVPIAPPKPVAALPDETDEPTPIVWADALTLDGTSTQLGSAIQYIVNKERGGPIAGVVVVTDGRSNSGVQPARAIAAAANAGVPIFPIGVGSTAMPKNIQVADIQAPPKVFPSDKFVVKGIVKATGLAGNTARVQLVSVDKQEQEAELVEDETTVRLLDDGQPLSVEFSVARQEQGQRRYTIRIDSVPGEIDPRDNQRATMVEIVERQTKVLLIAGGPNREFRFLRNQLFRDKDILLHVWLQSSKEGADQEADLLLNEFPQTREGVFFYDCMIAFDPDWRMLSETQTELLERWVAEKAGGLIVIAGPVNTPEWTRRPRGDEVVDKIRRLYPVSFYSQGTAQLKLGRFGGDQAFPLDFTREGRAAEFLWLGDTASDSQANWGTFDGVFGYYAVNEPKLGADVLANFADPSTAVNQRLPIYLASHFYGAGRVFFQASGEMWRIRRLDVEYFQQYYTKLIRWASQGRLLRESTRGVLMTDRERCWMGDQVAIQAILRTPQDEPLRLPNVPATILRPDGTTRLIELQAAENAVREGTFVGQFIASREGEYRISLAIPGSPDLEVLTANLEASIPDLEKEQPQRNDALLGELADKTNGHFFVGTASFQSDPDNEFSPEKIIPPQDQETFLTGTLDRFFQRKLMMWLLGLVATALTLEWTIRRLHKLA